MTRFRKRLPFRELGVPFKMLRARFANRGQTLPPWREQEIENGSLRLVEGIPLVHVRGSGREMGRALGRLIGEQATHIFRRYIHQFAPDTEGDLRLAREMEARLPEWFREEMRGMAETTELTYEQLLLGQCFLDIHKVTLCSTIAGHDKGTETGEMMMGRNLDFPALSIAHLATIVVVYEPSDGPRYCGVTWPGFLGILSGLNEDGLALAMMLVYGHSRREHLDGQPFPLVFRRVLAECGDVAQGVELLQTRPYCTTTNVILCDKGRRAARMQLHPQTPVTDHTTAEQPVIYCTNHFLDKRIKAFAFTWFSSITRITRLKKAVRSGEPLTPDRIKKLLQEVAIPFVNLQRILFLPERLELEVAAGAPSTGPRDYVRFPRERLFPQCEAAATTARTAGPEAGLPDRPPDGRPRP